MNSIFLRAKHWQLFIPLVVIPFIAMIIFVIIIAAITVTNRRPPSPEDFIWISYFFPVIGILSGFIQFAWFWNVITKLSKLVSDKVRFPMTRIKLFFFIPVIYFCILPFFISFAVKTTTTSHQNIDAIFELVLFGILIFILHLFSIFCILHTIYFSAKVVKCVEMQTNARFSNFVGDFFLIWFFPVGVWFLQPRINALAEKASNSLSSTDEELVDRF
ncbi:hypothetical protein [Fluviicola chungangensis]|uniref:DUF4328 domain-containing protein n=1 Tax=Fluviicola chungangensis TaxID=2597671 RepID=A0A556MJW2_9FLAO|nr:hypothetical protein [Fluviicola chungangensis]TSJ40180.1 hypothetical protein FO442_16410 [Fluviicola chungangensis]